MDLQYTIDHLRFVEKDNIPILVSQSRLLYDNLVDFGIIDISIHEAQKLTPTPEPGFFSRSSTGFMESPENLWTFLKEAAIFIVVALPYLVPVGAVITVTVLITPPRNKRNEAVCGQPR